MQNSLMSVGMFHEERCLIQLSLVYYLQTVKQIYPRRRISTLPLRLLFTQKKTRMNESPHRSFLLIMHYGNRQSIDLSRTYTYSSTDYYYHGPCILQSIRQTLHTVFTVGDEYCTDQKPTTTLLFVI